MARIRSIKPEFWNDRKLARLSRDARLLYIALWNLADEHGRLHGDNRYVKGHCFPYDDDLSLADVEALLAELAQSGRVVRYDHDEDPFLYLPKLARHQRLEAAKQESRLPKPPTDDPSPTALSVPSAHHDADPSGSRADKSAENPDSSGEIVAQQVAGSRLHVAGSRDVGTADAAPPPRTDVEAICQHLLTAIQANGCKGTISEKWRTEARLLLDRDNRSPDEIHAVIDWATTDDFWKSNILSVPKLREKFDQLRLGMTTRRRKPLTDGVASQPDAAYLEPGIFSGRGA